MTATARYLYCVVPAHDAAPAIRAPALDGGPVDAIRHRDVAVLTHACPPRPYQGSDAAVRGWIAAHNAVIEEAWEFAGTILPMSFDVIVRGEAGRHAEAIVAGWIEDHHAALRDRLETLRGLVEVGVQILRDAAEPPARPGQARPRGHAYFASHQVRRDQRERLEQAAAADFLRHRDMLAALAGDVRVNSSRPVPGKIMVLNLSLLADQAGVLRIGDYLEQVGKEPDTDVRFTGPWPPYSFAGTIGKLEKCAGETAEHQPQQRR